MATTAPVVECADRAAARARKAATIAAICTAFPTPIERRPKILRLGDKPEPFMFAVNCRSGDYKKGTVFHNVLFPLPQLGVVPAVKSANQRVIVREQHKDVTGVSRQLDAQ